MAKSEDPVEKGGAALEEQKTLAQSSAKIRFGKSAGSERLAIPLTRLRSSSAWPAPPFATSPLVANGGGWLIDGAESKRSDLGPPPLSLLALHLSDRELALRP